MRDAWTEIATFSAWRDLMLLIMTVRVVTSEGRDVDEQVMCMNSSDGG